MIYSPSDYRGWWRSLILTTQGNGLHSQWPLATESCKSARSVDISKMVWQGARSAAGDICGPDIRQ